MRLDPYHRTVAARHPDCAPAVLAVVDAMLTTRRALVHGDYSPKNVLAGSGGCWVIDFEVAHYGDPAFDVAFLTCHLLLKAVRRPVALPAYQACAAAFLAAYGGDVDLAHLGCLLLARVDGTSPAGYLDTGQEAVVRRFGRALLLDPAPDVWRRLERELAA